jgi:AcrR family transcriptional regulator
MPKRKKPAKTPVPAAPRNKRLKVEHRRSELIDAAARLVVEQGYLPLSIERLAVIAGVSKALVYSYFPTQYALLNAILEREVFGMFAGGLDTASQVKDLDQAALLCAMLYFEHVARAGPLLHILTSDRFMAGHVERQPAHLVQTVLGRLSALGRKHLPLSKQEVAAAIGMAMAIPEEAGRLVFHKELDAAVARQICHSLIVSSLEALRAPDRVLSSTHDVA